MSVLLFLSACVARIPAPPSLVLPGTAAAVGVDRACWIEFATDVMPHGPAVAHGVVAADVPSTQSGLLVQGAGGTWLIEGGMAVDLAHEIDGVKGALGVFLRRVSKTWERVATPAEGLAASGVALADVTGLLPTHGHWDHLGGLLSLPELPVWVPAAELAEAEASAMGQRSGVTPNDARALLPRANVLAFEGGALWAWETSHDLLGDGSVVVVPMPGHSPGSVGVRVVLPDGREVFLAGDTVWLREGFEQREPKGWLASSLVDADKNATAAQVAKLWSLHQARPEVLILPAHDRRSWVDAFGAPGCF